MKIEKIDIKKIKKYQDNPKEHSKEQIEKIKKSIQKFNFNDPIAIDEENEIIEGHGRLQACKELGKKTILCIRLSNLKEEQKKAYRIAHNRINLSTGFDWKILSKDLEWLVENEDKEFFLSTGFDEIEIKLREEIMEDENCVKDSFESENKEEVPNELIENKIVLKYSEKDFRILKSIFDSIIEKEAVSNVFEAVKFLIEK